MARTLLVFIAASLWLFSQATKAHAWRLEAGQVTTLNTASTPLFTSVTFQETFDVIPIVVALPSDQGGDPAALRIRSVTTSGFEISAVEPTGNDGPHISMTIHYIAIEPGTHILPDGTELAAGLHPTNSIQSKFLPSNWDLVPFGTTLDATASVVAAIQSLNSENIIAPTAPDAPSSPFLTVTTRNANTSSVELALERSEDTSGTVVSEDIGWIAFPSNNDGTFIDTLDNAIGWDARITDDAVVGWDNGCTTHAFSATNWPNARIAATKHTRDGVDGGWVRRCDLTGTAIGLVIDEDIADDPERGHTDERVALLSFSESFHANFEGLIQASKTVSTPAGGYALPGNPIIYTIAVESSGVLPIDEDAVVFVDSLPPEVAFRVADIDGPGSGPIRFLDGSPTSGLSYNFLGLSDTTDDVGFSNDGGLTFAYSPLDNGSGVDPNVTHIRINPKGTFLPETGSGNPNFELIFQSVIK